MHSLSQHYDTNINSTNAPIVLSSLQWCICMICVCTIILLLLRRWWQQVTMTMAMMLCQWFPSWIRSLIRCMVTILIFIRTMISSIATVMVNDSNTRVTCLNLNRNYDGSPCGDRNTWHIGYGYGHGNGHNTGIIPTLAILLTIMMIGAPMTLTMGVSIGNNGIGNGGLPLGINDPATLMERITAALANSASSSSSSTSTAATGATSTTPTAATGTSSSSTRIPSLSDILDGLGPGPLPGGPTSMQDDTSSPVGYNQPIVLSANMALFSGDTVTLQTSHDLKYLKQICCVEIAKPTTSNDAATEAASTSTGGNSNGGIGIGSGNLPSFDDLTKAAKSGMSSLLKGSTLSTGIPTMTDGTPGLTVLTTSDHVADSSSVFTIVVEDSAMTPSSPGPLGALNGPLPRVPVSEAGFYLRGSDGNYAEMYCCIDGGGQVQMLVSQKPFTNSKRGRFYVHRYNASLPDVDQLPSPPLSTNDSFVFRTDPDTDDSTGNSNGNAPKPPGTTTSDPPQKIGLFSDPIGTGVNYIIATPASIPYPTMAGAFDYGASLLAPAIFIIRKVGLSGGESVQKVKYHLPKAVADSRFVSVGHQTLINKSLRDQVMAMEVHESVTTSKQFLWTNTFRISPSTTFTAATPTIAHDGTFTLGFEDAFLFGGQISYDEDTELNGIFTVTVPQRSVLSARAIVNYARTTVPFSADIIRTVPSPETGEPIPYRYLTSGVYRGTCAWNMVYQIEAPPGFPLRAEEGDAVDPAFVYSSEAKPTQPWTGSGFPSGSGLGDGESSFMTNVISSMGGTGDGGTGAGQAPLPQNRLGTAIAAGLPVNPASGGTPSILGISRGRRS